MSVNLKPSNGVGYNASYVVTSADQSAGYVIFNFNTRNTIVAEFNLLSSNGTIQSITSYTISYPSAGQVKFAGSLTVGQIVQVIAGIVCELAPTSNLV